jgi:succinoglycan biosynthesis protein ExoA
MEIRCRPLVSVILAVRNEERHIEDALRSLLRQDTTNCDLEIVIVDGDSSDGTQEIVKRTSNGDSRVKLVINKHKKTPYAFNLGIQESQGEYICILGAHSIYAKNYVATCLKELHINGAGGCSGRLITRPSGGGLLAVLIAWALAHPFGTSSESTRTRGAGFADTIPYPIFLKSTLREVGAYDTKLHRNQDNDLSQRLRSLGYKLYITDKTYCEYCVSQNLVSLARYAFKTGFWNIISFKQNPSSMSIRHFVPGIFSVVLILSLLAFFSSMDAQEYVGLWLRIPLLSLGAIYGMGSIAAACHVGCREKSIRAFLIPLIFLLLHVSYGIGTLSAIMSNARPPSSQPNLARDATKHL